MIDRILVNDTITIDKEKCGNACTGFNKWFKLYGISTDNYDKVLSQHIEDDNIDERYRCIWMAPHLTTGEMLYAIRGLHTQKVFLVNKDAILVYNHTCGSHDNTDVVLKILSSEYSKLELKLEEIKSSIEEHSAAAADNLNVIPELEIGMFGIAKHLKTDKIDAFYVTEDTIIYESGSWDLQKSFDKTGKSGYTQILALYNGDVNSFTGAKALYYNNPDSSNLIWKKID